MISVRLVARSLSVFLIFKYFINLECKSLPFIDIDLHSRPAMP